MAGCLLVAVNYLGAAQLKEARVTQVIRDVKLLPKQAAPRPATVSDPVRDGTAVRTGSASRGELTFTDQTIARLGANTIFSFNEGTRNLDLGGGAMLLSVPKNAGGAKITTAAVTAAVTGTTLIMENHPATSSQPHPFFKIIVIEGTVRAYQTSHVGDSVLIHAGEMLIGKPGQPLPDPVHYDINRLLKTSQLINGFGPLPNAEFIALALQNQLNNKSQGQLIDTNLVIYGRGTLVSLVDPTHLNAVDQAVNSPSESPTVTPTPTPVTPTPTPVTPTPTPVTPTPTPVTPTPTPVTPTPTPVTPTPTPVTPTPTPPPTPSPTPIPTPSKFGTPSVIASDYVIDEDTTIQTDPSITKNGVTDYGKIYRTPAMDGSRSTWLFGSTSAFDTASGFDNGPDSGFLNQMAVFKFRSLEINGNPVVSTANGGATSLGLIGVNGLTTGDSEAVITFGGLDTLLLATQNGSIDLGGGFEFSDINRMYIYARGSDSNLTIGSVISTNNDLRLYSEGTVTIDGALSTVNFSSYSGGSFLGGLGSVTAAGTSITAGGDIEFDTDHFHTADFEETSLSLSASNTVNITIEGDQSVFESAGIIFVGGETINIHGPLLRPEGESFITLNLNVGTPAIFTAGTGGIQAASIYFQTVGGLTLLSDADIDIYGADIPFVAGSREIAGTIAAEGFLHASGNITSDNVTAGADIDVGGDFFTGSATAGSTITVGGLLTSFGTVTAGGDIIANEVRVPTIVSPGGTLTAGDGGIRPFVVSFGPGDGADLQHTFTISTIEAPAGIDFTGEQFDGLSDVYHGGKLTINADTLLFNSEDGGIAYANFDGAPANVFGGDNDGGNGGTFILNVANDITIGDLPSEFRLHQVNFPSPNGNFSLNGGDGGFGSDEQELPAGGGGTFTANAAGPITVNSDIEATSGYQPSNFSPAGDGGTVTLNSTADTVAVNSRIEVSSADQPPGAQPSPSGGSPPRRVSKKGGNINITSGKASGVAIDVANSAQLLALLDDAAPGPGGKITILATGANSTVNVKGTVRADRGTVDIRHTGSNGEIYLGGTNNFLNAHADVLKVGALGANGTLTVGSGNLSADSLIKLYAPGSNGELNFIANVTLSSGTGTHLAANTVSIQPNVVVTVAGDGGAANVYTNNPNYSGFGGTTPGNGTFGGNGANAPQPLASRPPFDGP